MKLLLVSTSADTIAAAQPRFPKPLKDAYVLCIPTAAMVYEERPWLDEEMDAVRAAGATLHIFDLSGKTHAEVAAEVARADAIYMTGGNTYYLLEQMRKCGFASLLPAFFARGGFYIGASAGAVITCPRIDFIGEMDDASAASITDYAGLNLVPFLVMVHTDHRKYGPIAQRLMHKVKPHETILGLTDSQALWVTDNAVELIQA